MSSLVELSRSRALSRVALLALIAAGVAGCSSDFSRMSENPWASKPQAAAAPSEVTGSVRPQGAPTGRVESSALAAPAPTYGGGSGMGSYQPVPGRPEVTGSVTTVPKQPPAQSWSWDGGTAIIVAQGDTVESISRRHNVPPSAILQANNMSHAGLIQPGQRLVIPRYAAAPKASAPQTRATDPATTGSIGGNTHVAAPGETIYSLARHYRLTPMAIAKANNVGLDHQLRVGERIVIPGNGQRIAMPAQPQPAEQRTAYKPDITPAVKPQNPPKVAQVDPPANARVITPAADPLPESAPTGTAAPTSTSFRWPVRGRILDPFGPKAVGGQNDGINISVPQGTPIKAAEDGVVAYSGSELKGYGNLVLVRHANGFVTAYAHASELSVKKGDAVKRGQVIGKAGATGNVSSPQLHFEVRKGATPVDPEKYLIGG